MKKTTTIENASAATLRTLQQLEEAIHTQHVIRCHKCGSSDEFNEGDPLDAAAWFQMVGWKARGGRVKCPSCARR